MGMPELLMVDAAYDRVKERIRTEYVSSVQDDANIKDSVLDGANVKESM